MAKAKKVRDDVDGGGDEPIDEDVGLVLGLGVEDERDRGVAVGEPVSVGLHRVGGDSVADRQSGVAFGGGDGVDEPEALAVGGVGGFGEIIARRVVARDCEAGVEEVVELQLAAERRRREFGVASEFPVAEHEREGRHGQSSPMRDRSSLTKASADGQMQKLRS